MKIAWLLTWTTLILTTPLAGGAELQHDLLVFGSAEFAHISGAAQGTTDVEEENVGADVLLSVQRNSLKLFGEYLLSNHEAELERFQLGWEPSDHSILWVGRFHQASSVWNHRHHHGQFLQTSITRPASEDWEDHGGIIPQHFAGALWESSWKIGTERELRTAVGGGIAPVMTPEGLEPFDLLQPNMRDHRFGAQMRIGYLPHELHDTEIGLLYAHNEIAARDFRVAASDAFDHIDQTVIGTYGRYDPWNLQVACYRVTTRFDKAELTGESQSFFLGYAQVEFHLSPGLEGYFRHENTVHASDSAYMRLFPRFVTRRSTLGARWQFSRSNAVTLELSDSHSREQGYAEFRLQWSGATL